MLKTFLVAAAFLATLSQAADPIRAGVSLQAGNLTGRITFTQTPQGVRVEGTISGIPQGIHGFHVHEKGDLSGGCASAGAHFNPENKTHGSPVDTNRHVGDLGNIVSDANQVAKINITDNVIALEGAHNIIGRAVVVHADADDLGRGGQSDSLTTGHAGARLACGVIGIL